MKVRFLTMGLLLMIASTSFSVDQAPFIQALDQSIASWEAVVRFSSLSQERVVRFWPYQTLVDQIKTDISLKNRYDEYAYLFNYLDIKAKDTPLKVSIINGRPPIPGFWPVLRNGNSYEMVVNSTDLVEMVQDPVFAKASFIRALVMLFNVEASPAFEFGFRNRNVLNEYLAYINGMYVEYLYLKDVNPTGEAPKTSKGYYSVLFESGANDDLAGISELVLAINMNYSYEILRAFSGLESIPSILDFVNNLGDFPTETLYQAFRLAYGWEFHQSEYGYGTFIRSSMIVIPWFLYGAYQKSPTEATEVDLALDNAIKNLNAMTAVYQRGDPVVLENRINQINGLGLLKPSFPQNAQGGYNSLVPLPGKGTHPDLQSTAWFRHLEWRIDNTLIPHVPLTPSQANEGAAYRLGYDSQGNVIMAEHFAHGSLSPGVDLRGAARIVIKRQVDKNLWFFENQVGIVDLNADGYALMDESVFGNLGLSVQKFYDKEGRQIIHESGAWQLFIRKSPNGDKTITLADFAGLPMNGIRGFSQERYTTLADGSLQKTLHSTNGNPVLHTQGGYYKSITKSLINYDMATLPKLGVLGNFEPVSIQERSFYGLNDTPVLQSMDSFKDIRFLGNNGSLIVKYGLDGTMIDGSSGFSFYYYGMNRGFLELVAMFNARGEPAISIDGYSTIRYKNNSLGQTESYEFQGLDGSPVLGVPGYAKSTHKYNEQGFMDEVWYYGIDGKPINSKSGAAHVRWSVNSDGVIESVEAWDKDGLLLTGGNDAGGLSL